MSKLFSPLQLGALELPHRVLMAPMTRNRADRAGVPTDLMVTYYRQRATAGLIITEATNVAEEGIGYPFTPGLYTEEQTAGWAKVVDAVHKAGGRIVAQLFHTGRLAHTNLTNGRQPVAPSVVPVEGQLYTYAGQQPYETPRALSTDEVAELVAQFALAAANARQAGFDGVEIHAANGYIIDQFLRDGSNQRTDVYGGSATNRARLLVEVAQQIVARWGADRVGVRFSPASGFNSMHDSNPLDTFGTALKALDPLGLAYIHVIDPVEGHMMFNEALHSFSDRLRPLTRSPYVINGGYDAARAEAALEKGTADAVAFGVPFLANPDLPHRLRTGADLNAPDFDTFYQGGEKGYIDYPSLVTA